MWKSGDEWKQLENAQESVPEEVYSASRAKSEDHMNGGVMKHMIDMEK